MNFLIKRNKAGKILKVFYSDFGAQSGHRAPLFYDLPECVKAFEYQNSQD
jgi:hypothetical protein